MVQWLALLPLLVADGTPGYKHVGGKHGVEVFRQEKSPTIDLIAEPRRRSIGDRSILEVEADDGGRQRI
jgi:hypothetical protein